MPSNYDGKGNLTREGMERAIKAGGSVIVGGKIISTLAELPAETVAAPILPFVQNGAKGTEAPAPVVDAPAPAKNGKGKSKDGEKGTEAPGDSHTAPPPTK